MAEDEKLTPVQRAEELGSYAEAVLKGAQKEQDVGNVGHAILSAELVDIAEGRNRAVLLAGQDKPHNATVLGWIERSAPTMLSRMASDRLKAGMDQKPYAHRIGEILQGNRQQGPVKSFLQKMMGGAQ